MKHPAARSSATRHTSNAIQREQELCLDALESGDYDTMTDKQWIELCEQASRDAQEAQTALLAESAEEK